MSRVVADISMSLDGFVTGPDAGPGNGLGTGGGPLHTWAVASDHPVDTELLREATDRTGAVVMGRRLFDIIDAPSGWSDETGYGAELAAAPPFVVVTHAAPAQVRLGLDFTFATEGLAAALDTARRAAGGGRDVVVMGGGDVIRQCIAGGHLDVLRIHLAPVILGEGTPLLPGPARRELWQVDVRVSPNATHLTYAPAR